MIFGWLKPEEEPEGKALTEISNDKGDHVVVETDSLDDAYTVQGIARRHGNATTDADERLSDQRRAAETYDARDHDQLRVRSGAVEPPNEDLEPESDDDSFREADEQPNNVDGDQSSSGGWWPFG
ncbi:MAG: hypothetical protein AAGE59_35205 [Cyanobacteria bacterium P01_F01_bin.86]